MSEVRPLVHGNDCSGRKFGKGLFPKWCDVASAAAKKLQQDPILA